MKALAGWLCRRIACFAAGHRMAAGRFYYPPAKSIESGFVCERCGKTQLLLYRWQEPVEGDEGGSQ